MAYKPVINDVVLMVHSGTLCEITSIHAKFKEVGVTILRCHIEEREGEVGHLVSTDNLRLVWRRERNLI